jgi:hypothetical protein
MRHSLNLAHRGENAISGIVELEVPSTWDATPPRFRIGLSPQRAAQFPLVMRYPHNEPAGRRTFWAKIRLEVPAYYMEVPLYLDVGTDELAVRALAIAERGNLVLRHSVTNQSTETLNFRSSAEVPGRERQYRPIHGLAAGQTQTVEYRFHGGAALRNAKARLSLRETSVGGRLHTTELNIP